MFDFNPNNVDPALPKDLIAEIRERELESYAPFLDDNTGKGAYARLLPLLHKFRSWRDAEIDRAVKLDPARPVMNPMSQAMEMFFAAMMAEAAMACGRMDYGCEACDHIHDIYHHMLTRKGTIGVATDIHGGAQREVTLDGVLREMRRNKD